MKSKIMAAMILSSFLSNSQSQTTFQTNWITAAPSFREVKGKLYNYDKSVIWRTVVGDYEETTNNISIFKVFESQDTYQTIIRPRQRYEDPQPGSDLGFVSSQVKTGVTWVEVGEIAITNYQKIAVEKHVLIHAMPVGEMIYKGNKLELLDCGTPHVVMVIMTNRPSFKK